MKRFLLFVFVAFAGGMVALGAYKVIENSSRRTLLSTGNGPVRFQQASYNGGTFDDRPDFVGSAEKTIHAVVHIKTEYQQKNSVYDYFFNGFLGFDNRGSRPYVATGSGVILTSDGYIVTNNHVVQDADYLEITLNDKRSYEGKVIGTDPSTDLALVKINENNLPTIAFGNSDNVRIGEWVLAIGNPFNLTSTVTAGIVSAKARNINILGKDNSIESFIQTDAVVNPGNSGGALVNTAGELIGINAAIASNTGSYTGYSFAIPANIVKKVVEDLMQYGTVQRGFIGITPVDITSEFARENGIDVTRGVYIDDVTTNGSAKEAGMQKGDVVTSINSVPVNSVSELLEAIGQHRPGEKISVTYNRDGKEKTVDLTLRNKQGSTSIVKKEDVDAVALLGATFSGVSNEEKRWLRIDGGVKVKELSSGLLSMAGVQKNFIITGIDNHAVKSVDDLEKVLNNKKGGIKVEGVYPNRMRGYYLVVIKE